MNPIAFLVFLAGINNTPPSTHAVAQAQKQQTEQSAAKPGPQPGLAKGIWDRN